jgi:hypothetical protein
MLLWPNLGVIVFLTAAWVVSWISGASADPLLYIVVSLFIISSIFLIWTELWSFPAPYSKELADEVFEQAGGDRTGGREEAWRITREVAAAQSHDSSMAADGCEPTSESPHKTTV